MEYLVIIFKNNKSSEIEEIELMNTDQTWEFIQEQFDGSESLPFTIYRLGRCVISNL